MRRFRVGPEDRGFQDIARIGHNGGPKLGDVGAFDSNPGADYVPADGAARLVSAYPDVGQVLKTRQGFASRVMPAPTLSTVVGRQIAIRDSTIFLNVTDSPTLLRSLDGGVSYTQIPTIAGANNRYSVVAPPGTNVVLAFSVNVSVSTSGSMLVSQNNGNSFSSTSAVSGQTYSLIGGFWLGPPHNVVMVAAQHGVCFAIATPYTSATSSFFNGNELTNSFAYRGDVNPQSGVVGVLCQLQGSPQRQVVRVYSAQRTLLRNLFVGGNGAGGVSDIKFANGLWVITTPLGVFVSRDDLVSVTQVSALAAGGIEYFDGVWVICISATNTADFLIGNSTLDTVTPVRLGGATSGVSTYSIAKNGTKGFYIPDSNAADLRESPGNPELEYFVPPFVSNADLKSGAYYMRAKP